MSQPSGWFHAVCITAIVLGALGILMGLFTLGMLAVRPVLQGMMAHSRVHAAPGGGLDAQVEMQREMQQVAYRWLPLTLPLMGIEAVVSICLIVGGARSLRLRPGGRALLIGAFWVAVVVELGQLFPAIAVQLENAAVTEKYMPRLMEAPSPHGGRMPPEFGGMMSVFTKAAAVLGMVVAVVMALAQVAFYVFGAIYLGRPEVRAQFTGPSTAELVGSG